MPEKEKKTENFLTSILNDARAQTDDVEKEIEKRRQQAFKQAEDDILNETYHKIRNEIARIRNESGREISRKMMDNKMALHKKREQVADRVFAEVIRRVNAFVDSNDYPGYLEDILTEARERFGDRDIKVYFRNDDMRYAAMMAKTVGEAHATLYPTSEIKTGGLIIECPDMAVRLDRSLDSAITNQRAHFIELFGIDTASREK